MGPKQLDCQIWVTSGSENKAGSSVLRAAKNGLPEISFLTVEEVRTKRKEKEKERRGGKGREGKRRERRKLTPREANSCGCMD